MTDIFAQQELESEWMARHDYWAEVAAGEAEDPRSLAEEAEMIATENELSGLRFDVSPYACGELDRNIPF